MNNKPNKESSKEKSGKVRSGKARMAKLSPEQRSALAKKAAAKRWASKDLDRSNLPKADYRGLLPVGDLEIPCYVLADGTRVISQRGIQSTVGMSTSGGTGGAHRTAKFVAQLSSKLSINSDLELRMRSPVIFLPPIGGMVGYGYEATTLIDLCDLILTARDRRVLSPSQAGFAIAADIVVRAFAKVGIIAVIDEVTGYQQARQRTALQDILNKFIGKDLAKWERTFPPEFYREIFRLKSWTFDPASTKRPMAMAQLTADLVYARLAPGVLDELRRLSPKDEKGRRKNKLFQRLTPDVGHPALKDHLSGLIYLARSHDDFDAFYRAVDRVAQKYGKTLMLPFPDPGSGT